jgi:myo-inositol-1(or 4)-monophosphatase
VTTRDELLETAVAAARAGGNKLIEGLERPKQVTMKSSRANIVTWADEASQAAVVDVILGAYPDHAVMGEEGDAGRPDGDYTWIVDPLDGTTNYASGLPFWGVSVAVRETGGDLIAGAILDPLGGELFSGVRGGGTELAVSENEELRSCVIATGLQNDDPGRIARYARMVEALYLECRSVRILGSPALALAYVAAGRLDGFTEKDATYAWDIAAATLLIEEAGGRVTDFDGTPPNLGQGQADVVASNGAIHDELLATVDLEGTRLG